MTASRCLKEYPRTSFPAISKIATSQPNPVTATSYATPSPTFDRLKKYCGSPASLDADQKSSASLADGKETATRSTCNRASDLSNHRSQTVITAETNATAAAIHDENVPHSIGQSLFTKALTGGDLS